jgi:hypothetical protein
MINKETSFSELPQNAIEEIFTHLSPDDRKFLKATSKSFSEAEESHLVKEKGKQVFKVKVDFEDEQPTFHFTNSYLNGKMMELYYNMKNQHFYYEEDLGIVERPKHIYVNINEPLRFGFSHSNSQAEFHVGSSVIVKIEPSNYVPQLKKAIEKENKFFSKVSEKSNYEYTYLYIDEKGFLSAK